MATDQNDKNKKSGSFLQSWEPSGRTLAVIFGAVGLGLTVAVVEGNADHFLMAGASNGSITEMKIGAFLGADFKEGAGRQALVDAAMQDKPGALTYLLDQESTRAAIIMRRCGKP